MAQPLRLVDRSTSALPAGSRGPKARDPRAFRREVFTLVYRQMRSLAGNSPDLDDLVQSAAEQIFRALPTFSGRSELGTWTYRICYHTLLNQRRWYRRWLRRFTLTLDGSMPDPADARHGPREALESRERAERVRRALERVSPKRRVVVVLHDFEGMDLKEVATVVDAPLLTVRSRLRDGRRMLLDELSQDPYFGDQASAQEAP